MTLDSLYSPLSKYNETPNHLIKQRFNHQSDRTTTNNQPPSTPTITRYGVQQQNDPHHTPPQNAEFLEMRANNITSLNSTSNFNLQKRSRHLIHGDRGETGFHYCYSPHYHNPDKFPTRIDTINVDHVHGKMEVAWRGTKMGFEFKITPSEDIIEGTQLWPSFLPWSLDNSDAKLHIIQGDAVDICSLIECPAPAGQQIQFTAKVLMPEKLYKTTRTLIFGTKIHFEFAVPMEEDPTGEGEGHLVLTCAERKVEVYDERNTDFGCEFACH
ncbi:hypothetical protein AC578_3665 [Pseudocercospora eumusae]|uniref:Uncharacterized protein n=1 Tax=Pseudocercospora eumusae TaxID=321146 RepID=A0A139GXE0_9PEZI|nr:hypothetical protein AC578_3665 [Pseudocercospora eumusae]